MIEDTFKKQFATLPEITGLPFKRRGSRLISATYINGSKCAKIDKTYAVLKERGVYIKEQGGEDLSLPEWLRLYGDESKGFVSGEVKIEEPEKKERIFVDLFHLESTIPSEYSGNLFAFLSKVFSPIQVREVFHMYNVGESENEMIFWRMNQSGKVCYDSRVIYDVNGKRLKKSGGYRKHLVDDGYSGTCLFGAHLIKSDSDVCVVESEKAALIMAMVEKRGRIWCATGGSNNFNGVSDNMKLYPDYDNAGSFWECFVCSDTTSPMCVIKRQNGRRIKPFGCDLRNKNMVEWWKRLEVEDGWGVDDWVLNNKNVKI